MARSPAPVPSTVLHPPKVLLLCSVPYGFVAEPQAEQKLMVYDLRVHPEHFVSPYNFESRQRCVLLVARQPGVTQ